MSAPAGDCWSSFALFCLMFVLANAAEVMGKEPHQLDSQAQNFTMKPGSKIESFIVSESQSFGGIQSLMAFGHIACEKRECYFTQPTIRKSR
jgi:hypothetical protein